MLRNLVAITGLAMIASLGAAASPASASEPAGWVNTGKACNWQTYKSHYTAAVSSKAPAVTHIQTFGMPPSASHTVTKTVHHSTTLSAAVNYNTSTSVGAEGAAKILVKASAEVHFGLKASGSHTTSTSTTVTDVISNPTSHNANFVFYAGWTKVTGSFRYYFCEEQSSPRHTWHVYYKPGKWRSYGIYGEGAVRCGAGGTLNALQKAALRIGCA